MKDVTIFLKKNLTQKRLENISTMVINAYKNNDGLTLKSIADSLDIDTKMSLKHLFYKIIQKLHPDRFTTLMNDFLKAKADSDIIKLKKLKKLLEIKSSSIKRKTTQFEYSHSESWVAESMFFEEADQYSDNENYYEYELSGSFISAVKSEIFGNHNFSIEPADLNQIDGNLNLSFYSLKDIQGIEYCKNLRTIDFSGNEINNIFDIAYLYQLEELYASQNNITDISALSELKYLEIIDLSDNDIEDFSPLLEMENLKFANISKNPIEDFSIVEKLKRHGVILL